MSVRFEGIRESFVLTLLTVLITLTAAGPSAGQDQMTISEEQFMSWVRDTAIRLESLDRQEDNGAALSFLDDALEGKRIVYLGASDHWIREKYDYRLFLINYLFNRGWRCIGMEMGYSDGKRVDRYLETGNVDHLGRVALYGYEDDLRADREDRPQHFLGMKNPRFRNAFVDEERRFLHGLRHLNESLSPDQPRLRWFGYDVSLLPGGNYVDALGILERHANELVIRDVVQRLERVHGETRAQEIQRLRDALGYLQVHLSDLQDALGEADTTELIRTIRNLTDSYLFCEAATDGTHSMKWILGLKQREEAMIVLMDELLSEFPSSEKIILMGHNLHLNKDSENILLGPVGTAAPTLWTTLGTHLARELPGQVYSTWLTYDHGRHGAVLLAEGVEDVQSDPTRIERLFLAIGAPFILPLTSSDPRESYLNRERNFNQNGTTASGRLSALADAVVFVPVVTEFEER